MRFHFHITKRYQMRTVAMCLSVFQGPKYGINNLAGTSFKSFHSLTRKSGKSASFKLDDSNTCNEFEERSHYKKSLVRRISSTQTEKGALSSKTNRSSIRHEISDATITSSTASVDIIQKPRTCDFERIQHCDVQQKIAESKEITNLLTIIVFDLETTGFSREQERIIEIALQDLSGGVNSTFHTLINPERIIPNPHIHGISTTMVNRPDVPKMKELIPILLEYVKSREKPGGQVLFIAHNGRSFDVPFLVNEFTRNSFEIPPNWLFLDSMGLARERVKSGGQNLPVKLNLQALREYYEIPLVGSAHRAMSDVNTLSLILQRLTLDMKLTVSGLLERSFSASDLNTSNTSKKKKNPN